MITAIFKGFYPYFLPLVGYGIFLRIYEKKWTRAETILMLLFLGHALLMFLQVAAGGGHFSRRYLLPGIPLAFGWAGYALCSLSLRRFFYPTTIFCVLFLLQDACRPSLEHYWKRSKKEEFFVIRELSPVIQQDWHDRSHFFTPEIWWDAYHSPKRPLVRCEHYPLLGYASGGSSISQSDPLLPLPDYRVFVNSPVSSSYVEIYQIVHFGKIYRIGKLIK